MGGSCQLTPLHAVGRCAPRVAVCLVMLCGYPPQRQHAPRSSPPFVLLRPMLDMAWEKKFNLAYVPLLERPYLAANCTCSVHPTRPDGTRPQSGPIQRKKAPHTCLFGTASLRDNQLGLEIWRMPICCFTDPTRPNPIFPDTIQHDLAFP
eukprot:jgi/Mesvir1/11256/Mv25495-RA.1